MDGAGSASFGQRRRETIDNVRSSFIATSSSCAGRASIVPSSIIRLMTSSPSSVRTIVSVQALSLPMPPVEMSACSAAKSGQCLQPSRVQAWHSLRSTSWYEPSFIQIWKTPLMFILTISDFCSPYLASNSSVKIASSNVFEHSSPMLNTNGLDTLPALRSHIVGGDDVWQPIPTSASRLSPSLLRLTQRQRVGAVRVPAPGRRQHLLGGVREHRLGLPRVVVLDA